MAGGKNMTGEVEKIYDRFSKIRGQNIFRQSQNIDTLSEYSLREGYGLTLRRRRRFRKQKIIL